MHLQLFGLMRLWVRPNKSFYADTQRQSAARCEREHTSRGALAGTRRSTPTLRGLTQRVVATI